ncbi:hypothetical protein MLD38_004511 [Melastoma candidum]|uniref:Uncharacterized protein n=1 Tax=Melastoma candidum TaxID=119954 RepID=A0ACB9S5X6_9MYRT|nr:hypothetical protein MLD38_004511 [Melastoma candidum]
MAMEVLMCSSSCGGTTDLSPEEEMILVKDLAVAAETATKEGDTFYLLSQSYVYMEWIDLMNRSIIVAGSTTLRKPGLIDNSTLIFEPALEGQRSNIEIHETLLEGRDYVLLPHEVWSQLHSWELSEIFTEELVRYLISAQSNYVFGIIMVVGNMP